MFFISFLIIALCVSFDHTFDTASKARVVNSDHTHFKPLKSLLCSINEETQILAWVILPLHQVKMSLTSCVLKRMCLSMSFKEITELLAGIRHRHEVQGVPVPKLVTADNCCQVRNAVTAPEALPKAKVMLDVRHFKQR
jgi:Na+-translocating ferredoxin:NAD+ oxidoreductase RnfA subunit